MPKQRKPKADKPKPPEPGDTGRPTKYYETKDEVMKWISMGNSLRDSCTLAGISTSTFHQWRKDFSEFSEELKKALAQCKAARIGRILAASKKSWTAAAWWLERMYSSEFALKRILETPDAASEDEYDRFIENLKKDAITKTGGEIEEDQENEEDIPRFL